MIMCDVMLTVIHAESICISGATKQHSLNSKSGWCHREGCGHDCILYEELCHTSPTCQTWLDASGRKGWGTIHIHWACIGRWHFAWLHKEILEEEAQANYRSANYRLCTWDSNSLHADVYENTAGFVQLTWFTELSKRSESSLELRLCKRHADRFGCPGYARSCPIPWRTRYVGTWFEFDKSEQVCSTIWQVPLLLGSGWWTIQAYQGRTSPNS